MNAPKAKPIHEVRYGSVKAAVWRNETESGPRFNTTFTRVYRDGEQWKTADSFGREDLLLLGKVASEAHTWIYQQARETPQDTSQQPAATPAGGQPPRTGSGPGQGSYPRNNRPNRDEL